MTLVCFFVIVNLTAFFIYGADKFFAKAGKRRVPEKSLLFWAWAGGSIGAFLGMKIFHHKTLKTKFAITVPVLTILEILICIFCLYQNYHLVTTEYEVDLGLESDLTVVQVSDLHNQFFGINESVLLRRIGNADPDIIVVTGDLVDTTHTSYDIALDFIKGAVKIAPVYYVTGNHEENLKGMKLDDFFSEILDAGVIFVDDTYIDNGEYIIAGIADSSLNNFSAYGAFDGSKPVILLAHEPQYHALYEKLGADLALTGHFHGGQIIIPGVGGVISPEFEFFPEMYEGMHTFGDTSMIISRGLGNSVAPVRINNYPEVVVVKVRA